MITIADNLHIMHPKVAKAIKERNPQPLREIAEQCNQASVYAMDINPGPLKRNGEEVIVFILDAVQDCFEGRLVLDSVQANIIEAGIVRCNKPPLINGFSLEEHKLQSILPLAAKYQTDIIGFLIDERGRVPLRAEDRLALATRLLASAEQQGIPPEKVIIDPVLVPLSWQEGTRYNRELLEVLRLLPQIFDTPPRTIAGLSNLTSGAPFSSARNKVEISFTFMLAGNRLDYLLLNINRKGILEALSMSQLLLGEKIFSWEEVKSICT